MKICSPPTGAGRATTPASVSAFAQRVEAIRQVGTRSSSRRRHHDVLTTEVTTCPERRANALTGHWDSGEVFQIDENGRRIASHPVTVAGPAGLDFDGPRKRLPVTTALSGPVGPDGWRGMN